MTKGEGEERIRGGEEEEKRKKGKSIVLDTYSANINASRCKAIYLFWRWLKAAPVSRKGERTGTRRGA